MLKEGSSMHVLKTLLHRVSPRWFRFQSADRNAGRIYLRKKRWILYLPTLCCLNLDNRSVAAQSLTGRQVNGWDDRNSESKKNIDAKKQRTNHDLQK